MNIISFSLFKDCPDWLFPFYLKGVEYNVRMAKLLFPGWKIHIQAPENLGFIIGRDCNFAMDESMQNYLRENAVLGMVKNDSYSRCEAMLWRLFPIYNTTADRVICRDLDAILTYRDFKSVERWIESGCIAHGMNDNPAHGGLKLMGGMCGFKAKEFKELFPTWESLVAGENLKEHGSDQSLLMSKVYPKVEHSFYFDQHPQHYPYSGLAESDLTCRHIGSAGVVEMELERFLHKYEK